MTEHEWQICTDPAIMLDFLRDRVSGRKVRLFTVACCRRAWDLLEEWRQRALERVEGHADEPLSEKLLWFLEDAEEEFQGQRPSQVMLGGVTPWWELSKALHSGATEDAKRLVDRIAGWRYEKAEDTNVSLPSASDDPVQTARPAGIVARAHEQASQCHLLRNIIGNPFQPKALSPSWLTPEIAELAQSMYDSRNFDRLPKLAELLETSGCHDAEILGHCRNNGEHVRGCWPVDLLTAACGDVPFARFQG
jgi:hypothetical protein